MNVEFVQSSCAFGTNLESHDASKIHFQRVGGLEDPLLVLDPADGLAAFDMVCLHSVSIVEVFPLCLGLFSEFGPFVVQLKLKYKRI